VKNYDIAIVELKLKVIEEATKLNVYKERVIKMQDTLE